jgi:hypothetical protein
MRERGAWRQFLGDLGLTLRVWAKAPMLPILTIALGAYAWFLFTLPPSLVIPLAFVMPVISLGFYGAQRIWYLRAFRKQAYPSHEIVAHTIAFIGPFLGLGFMLFLVSVPSLAVAALLDELGVDFSLAFGLTMIPIDVVATFMTPALAYSTLQPSDAFKSGLQMLKDQWPQCAFYALAPPLAIAVAVQTLPESAVDLGWRIVIVSVPALLNLWFKGATAAFYLRRHPEVGEYGSLRAPAEAATP